MPATHEPLHRVVHRMAHMHFLGPLPPEQLAPDSYIKLSFIMEGVPRYFDGDGAAMDWHDGVSGHVPPRKGIVATSDGPVRCLMVNFYPSAFHRLFGGSVGRFNGLMVPPEQVLGTDAAMLYSRLRATREPLVALDAVKDHLVRLVAEKASEPPSVIAQLERYIRDRQGMVMVHKLALLAGLSERQLQRRFREEIGLSPKAFCSVVRFNQVYSEMKRRNKLDLDVAIAYGYFDESHMLKDLSHFLGRSPKRFASLVRPMVDLNLGH
ncbi:MAG: AraC family transcriptional regulator [Flavobacteriales bacterium]|nr:AraC family transcriptional regulator [Flavobacteriales bacterium]